MTNAGFGVMSDLKASNVLEMLINLELTLLASSLEEIKMRCTGRAFARKRVADVTWKRMM